MEKSESGRYDCEMQIMCIALTKEAICFLTWEVLEIVWVVAYLPGPGTERNEQRQTHGRSQNSTQEAVF